MRYLPRFPWHLNLSKHNLILPCSAAAVTPVRFPPRPWHMLSRGEINEEGSRIFAVNTSTRQEDTLGHISYLCQKEVHWREDHGNGCFLGDRSLFLFCSHSRNWSRPRMRSIEYGVSLAVDFFWYHIFSRFLPCKGKLRCDYLACDFKVVKDTDL